MQIKFIQRTNEKANEINKQMRLIIWENNNNYSNYIITI